MFSGRVFRVLVWFGAPEGDAAGVEAAAVPLRQRRHRHAHTLRRADHGGMASVSFNLTLILF